MIRSRSVFAALTALGATLAAPSAVAQHRLGGFELEQLDPTPAGDTFFGVPSASAEGHVVPRAYLLYHHAFEPLVVGDDAIVSHQAFLVADASLSLFDRLLISLDFPLAVFQSGDSPTVSGVEVVSPDAAEAGDLRLGVRGRLYGENRAPIQVGLQASFFLPTAGSDSLAGEGAPRVEPRAMLSGRADGETSFLWAASGGVMMRGTTNPHTVTYGVGAGVAFLDDLVVVTAEVFGATLTSSETALSTARLVLEPSTTTSLELLGGARLRVLGGLTFGLGGGPGLTGGVGTPTGRLLALAGWMPAEERDRALEDDDADGVNNGVDACPTEKGEWDEDPRKSGCAPPDRDGDRVPDPSDACPSLVGRPSSDPTQSGCPSDYDRDGVPDSEDACPNQLGVSSPDRDRNGCPGDADADADGVADRADACPSVKGSRNDDPTKNGCPTTDGDGDGIADVEDACPSERGLPDPKDKSRHGCPKAVRVTTGEIVILRQVTFRLAQSTLDQTVDPVSDDLLTEVRDVILEHPEIERIEVQGHADDSGTAEFNAALSQARAEAVRSWLIKRGVDAKRLSARGYGSTRPIDTNQSESGRQKNRRVQFVIIQKK